MRWMKWSVRAKSGTSLEREIRRRSDITLLDISLYSHLRSCRFAIEHGEIKRGRARK